MEQIGEKLRSTRESMGITLEEASQDLKVRVSQIENIEAGNKEAFKDVFYLKMFIKNYAKYLGLDYEEMEEEFNEYLFDFTSKISLDDIKSAEREQKKKDKNLKDVKIVSPYTMEKSEQYNIPPLLKVIGILVGLIIIIYIIVLIFFGKKDDEISNVIGGREVNVYELA